MKLIQKILVMSLVLLAGCEPDARIPRLFGGADGVAAMNAPDKVEAWRTISQDKLELDQREGKKVPQTKGKLADYLIVEGPAVVDAPSGVEIATILQGNIYDWDQPPVDCIPNPGFAVQFTKGTNSVLVFFCFECSVMDTYFNGGRAGYADFGHGNLLPLLQRVSP